ncbi:MAG: malectin domain-containing carbohydrate-binding protein, partial [Pseudomonadota bacterium]
MAVTDDFTSSELDLNGQVNITSPTALVWGPDGRLYVTEVDGDIKVLDVSFGDKDPTDGDPNAQFYVTAAEVIADVKSIPNYNDDGTQASGTQRQVTGIDVTKQYDADGNQVFIDGQPAVVMYVTSSDSRIGAGGGGADLGLDTNSGTITRLVQTDTGWEVTDLVRGLGRSEENHATNGLEVIQELDGDGKLVSERLIVANGGNANTGAPSNNFAGQQEQPYSAAILEVDLDQLNEMAVQVDSAGRSYIYNLPTLDDPTRDGTDDNNDPFGGNDGVNSAKLTADSPVQIYSAGYRNAYDVEVTEDGRVWTYDNGANNNWGGRPAGEDEDGDVDAQEPENGTPDGYIATNLPVEDNTEIEGNFNPANWDQLHEVTRSDDLEGRTLSAGLGGAQTYTWNHPDLGELELVYGGHPNPTRAEGARAGILYSPSSGTQNSLLMVSNVDKGAGTSDFLEVVAWLEEIGYSDAFINSTVVAVDPGVRYSETFIAGFGIDSPTGRPATTGVFSLVEDLDGPVGLPSDIDEIVHALNPIEGNYLEAGFTDGALDTGKGSINGLAEYTSTIFDDADASLTMQGALIASVFNGNDYLIIGRDTDGIVQTGTQGGRTVAAEKEVVESGGAPLGVASIGDDLIPHGGEVAFRGSIWGAIYKQNGPVIEILQPGNADNNALLPVYAGQEPSDPTDNDLDGVDHVADPFEYSQTNGYALGVGEKLVLDFDQVNINPEFSGSLGDSGILGAALDGSTPNRDAKTEDDGFTDPEDLEDGLFDNGGNIIPGGNAPILQIKKVKEGTMVGAANTVRDALHTGVNFDADVQRLVASVEIANWAAEQFSNEGRVSGLTFGDGTQSNFIRFVFGDVGSSLGLEVGVEVNDQYTVLGTTTDQNFIDQLTVGNATLLGQKQVLLELEISDIGGDYNLRASYRVVDTNGDVDAEGSIDFGTNGAQVPEGVLRDVLDGTHTVSDGDTEAPSGAAIGIVAEKGTATDFETVDINVINIEAFGNEIQATTAQDVGAAGTAGEDTIIYTGTETNLAALDPSVENFDGTGSSANYDVTGNALDNTIAVGSGTNTISTGDGEDLVRGDLSDLAGDTLSDFSIEDKLLLEDLAGLDPSTITYQAGSAIMTINGQTITFDGDEFTDFDASLGSEFFSFENTEEGLLITLTPPETVIYRVNAGSSAGPAATQGTIAALDDGPDWLGDADLIGPNATGVTVTLGGANNTFTNGQTNAEAEIDSGNVDLSIVPWEVFAAERSDNSSGNAKLTYDFDVIEGQTYKVTLFYTENWPGIFEFADVSGSSRQFDVALEGSIPTEFEDLNPAQEAATLLGLGTVSDDMSDTDKAAILGTAFQREATYTATDDLLTLEFEHDVENPKINAIQVTLLGRALDDSIPPVIQEITVSNDQGDSDSPRTATVVVVDAGGFDIATVANLSPTFAGIEPSAVGAPQVSVSSDGLTATITYELSAPASGWPTDALGQINLADGAFEDAAGNASAQASEEFYINPFLSQLDRGAVVRAINIGTTDTTEATGLDADPLDGGAVDNNRYGGAIAADNIILDAFGNPIEFEADNNAFHTSSKSTTALNNNVDGELGSTGSNSGGVDIDGSAYHTYRDSNAATWTSTFDGFANGAYIVELHFAELFHGTAAQRVGDFTVNGVVFGNDYDAYVEGGNSADAPSFVRLPVIVTDGTIEVEVSSSDGQAGYSAIVVYDAVDPNLPPSISVADVVVGEDDGDAIITFTRDGDLSEDITINFSVSGDTADASDFGTASPSPITILAGQTTATATLPITDDDEQENAETITVTINNVTNASADATISDGTATITIAASDSPFQAPVGNTIFELDFEGVSGEPTAVGGFDGALGGVENIVDEDAEVVDGQLVVQTSEGDINDGTDDGSQNDFTKTVDLSDPSLTEVYLSTRFDNPFTEDLLTSQGVTDGVIPSFVQQGIVFGTGSQLTGEMVKLVWGGVANGTGSQLWTKGGTPNQPVTFDSMVENGTTLFDVASVELSLAIDRANGTVGQYVTLFNEAGDMIGGVRPEAETGFATAAPVDLPPAVLANLNSSTDLTHVGVTSSDNSSPIGSFTSFEVKWDTLLLSSPQFVEPTGAIDTVNGVAVSGEDFSDDHLAPTDIGTLAEGETTIVATQQGDNAPGGRERDYFTFTVADGQQLTGIILEGFETDEQGTPQAFIGINDTGQIPTDPVTFENVEQMLGGYVYNSGDVVNQATSNDGNLLDELGDGSEFDGPQEILFRGGEGFEGPLPAGTYTIWLNQGGDASTATLKLVTEPVAQVELSVAAPAPVEEAGDVGVTTIDFVVTADYATFSGTVDVTFDTTSAIDQNQQLTFVDGVATLSVDFANDDVDDGDSAVGVTLTGASPTSGNTEFTISDSADTATATVTEDDATRFLRGEVVFAINAGGPALNFDGIDFSAGTGADDGAPFGGGSQFTDGNGGNGQQSVFDDTVYETEINGDQDGDFTFSTASGIDPEKLYYVDLYLAEIFASFPGERLFNVFVEDEVNPTVENFDILDTTGDFNTPIVLQLQEPISPGANGAIDLSFVAVTDRAKISGIVIREAVPIDDDVVLISVSDVTVDESASEVLITFTRTGNDSEDVTVEFSSADGTATDGFDYTAVSGSVIVPAAGDGTVTVSIPLTDDLIAEGDETFSVSIDNATAPTKPVTVEQAVATVTISDDDAIDPLDIDGDGILNTDDPFAYDSFNGKATVLSDGGSFRQDFDTDTADVFSADGGFTGILVNPAFDPAGISEADPYGDRTTEATSLIEGGVLKVESSETDTFGGGTGANNTIKDNYQRAADVSGVTGFTVEAKALNPFSTPLGGAFASLGITMGAGGVDDAVKLVFGNVAPGGNLQLRIEIAGQNSFSGGNQSITLASDDGLGVNAPTPDEIASVLFQLNVFLDETGAQPEWKLQGVVTFFDDADAELGTITTAVKTATGSLLAAIEGNNPLTGGDGGLAYGVSITDWGSGDANRFTGEWDYLELYGPPTVAIENPVALLAEDTDLSQSVKVADISASGTGVDVSALSLSGEDAASFIIVDNSGALELHVAAETDIDFETIGSLDVTVVATNSAGSTSSDLALPIGDVNEAPSITLEDVVTVISEDADTTSSTKVATILVEDDALGAEVLALTGEDAGLFEIVDNNGVQELRLISGVELSDETNPALDVSVTVDDATVGSGVDDTVQLTLAVLDGDDTPTVDQGIAAQAVDQDALYSFTVPADAFADDGGVENLSFTASLADDSALPEWLDFD